MSNQEVEVKFRPKLDYQKEDCIFPGCENTSTLEATTPLSAVRCCASDEHMSYAAELAKIPHKTVDDRRKVPAENFLQTVAVNVDNAKLSDAEFRQFIRNTLPIVIY